MTRYTNTFALETKEVDALIDMRRHLHKHPELSFEEHQTSAFIEEKLKEVGIHQLSRCATTGVVALIEGAHPGPTLAFRGDIDALPIIEDSDAPYASNNPGVMHACGHDVHTTLGLGVARYLWKKREQIHGRIKCIFQPAEEASPTGYPIGAEAMAQEGVLTNPDVDAIFAFHCMPTLEVGKIGYTGGPVWAGSNLVEIEIEGAKTHAAYPHSGIDSVVVASHVIMALQTIPSRRLDARHPCVLSIGKLEAGESYNIIAQTAKLTGILRTLSNDTTEEAKRHIVQSVEGICASFGAKGTVTFTQGARLTENDRTLEARTVSIMQDVVGQERMVSHLPQMGAEDFAAFSTRVPGCYLFLGIRNEDRGITHMLHTTKFDVDEDCLPLGVYAMGETLLRLGATW